MGGLGANRFLFGQNAGNDLIVGFNASGGDRIDLQDQGESVGTGADGAALITLSGGGTIDLVGIDASQVTASFFVGARA